MDTFSKTDALTYFIKNREREYDLLNQVQNLQDDLQRVTREREKFEKILIEYIKKEYNI